MSSGSRPKFWKPGADAPGSDACLERPVVSGDGTSENVIVYNPHVSMSITQQRQRLPVYRYRSHILYLLENYRTVIIVGETGCGKSTQIPQYLLESGWTSAGRTVAVTQPRRVAAVTLATRVAEERGGSPGGEVGYAVRFDDCSDAATTRVRYVTDGLLVREMMSDPLLTRYTVVMLDEAHERTLHTDIAIGLLRKIQKRRKDLRIVVASATLDAERFFEFFNDNDSGDTAKDTVAVMSVEGRTFPVDVFYSASPVPDYLRATVETVMKIHRTQLAGDILAFLTGQDQVENVTRLLINEAKQLGKDEMKMRVLPMYGGLPAGEQMRVFERTPHGVRKVVVATNVAETSITVDGISFVIDCGFVKLCAYNVNCGAEALVITPVSQASAEQRAGRAGRVRAGQAYRLYTESAYAALPVATVPEMQRCDTAPVLLQLKALGIDNILRFEFLSPPPADNVVRGLELLYALGALDDACHLTDPLGRRMAELPLSPMLARALLASAEFDCSEEMVAIAAMSQIQNVFLMPSDQRNKVERERRKFSAAEGDHITALNVYRAFVRFGRSSRWCKRFFLNYRGLCRADELREHLIRALAGFRLTPLKSCGDDVDVVRRCLTLGYFANAARFHHSGVYRTIRDSHTLHIHATSVLYTVTPPPSCVLFTEIVHGAKECMRDITVIKPEWLYELAPHYYQYGTDRERAAKHGRFTDD